MGSLISGILGGGQSDAQAGQTAALRQAAENAQAYRPEAMQARLNLLNKASGAYQGMNNALETMYGGRGKVGGAFRDAADKSTAQPSEALKGTFGGHQIPQQPMPQQPPQRPQQQGSSFSLLDPLGIFNGRR